VKPTINLLIVDDHVMFRDGLTALFEQEADLNLLGSCGSVAEALDFLKRGPQVVLLNAETGGADVMEFLRTVRKTAFSGHILIVTSGISGSEAVQLVNAGVAGIIRKQRSAEELCGTIRTIAAGDVYLEPPYLSALMRSTDKSRAEGPTLTERDRGILRNVLKGSTNREIGVQLGISEAAVKASIRQLFEKLGARTRAQLVKVVLEQFRDQF